MNEIGGFFRRLGQTLSNGMRSFMAGRYGNDKMNMTILGIGLILCMISMFIKVPAINLILTVLFIFRKQGDSQAPL